MRFLDLLRELIAPRGWQAGPVVWRWHCWPFSYSKGMPVHPAGQVLELDGAGREIHYLTEPCTGAGGSLTIRVMVAADPWVQFVPLEKGKPVDGVATMSLYLERQGNRWGAEPYRWWAAETPLTVGEHILSVPLDHEHWTSVMTRGTPEEFADTLAHLARRGLTFGGPTGRGHGVYATGPARITWEVLP